MNDWHERCWYSYVIIGNISQILFFYHNFKVISLKKKIYYENKAKGIIPPTIQELTEGKGLNGNDNVLANSGKTLSDTVFKGYRDDLDFNDENDVGEC